MVKLTQLILHIGDEMNVEQKRYGYGQANIFADTRAEWMLSVQACLSQSFPVVTLYTNLGMEAVVHGLNETKVDTVITSHELLPKLKQILKDTPFVKKHIYFENQIKETDTTGKKGDNSGKI